MSGRLDRRPRATPRNQAPCSWPLALPRRTSLSSRRCKAGMVRLAHTVNEGCAFPQTGIHRWPVGHRTSPMCSAPPAMTLKGNWTSPTVGDAALTVRSTVLPDTHRTAKVASHSMATGKSPAWRRSPSRRPILATSTMNTRTTAQNPSRTWVSPSRISRHALIARWRRRTDSTRRCASRAQ